MMMMLSLFPTTSKRGCVILRRQLFGCHSKSNNSNSNSNCNSWLSLSSPRMMKQMTKVTMITERYYRNRMTSSIITRRRNNWQFCHGSSSFSTVGGGVLSSSYHYLMFSTTVSSSSSSSSSPINNKKEKTINMTQQHHQQQQQQQQQRVDLSSMSNYQNHTSMSSSSSSWTKVIQNGTAISIWFPETEEESIFHAGWLWINDPRYKHPTSGQRLRTPGQYPSTTMTIVAAEIISQDDNDDDKEEEEDSNNDSTSNKGNNIVPFHSLPPPPPQGSFHSIGGLHNRNDNQSMNITTANNKNKHNNRRIRQLLQVTWKMKTSNNPTSSDHHPEPSTSTLGEEEEEDDVKVVQEEEEVMDISLYDFNWLERCRYDNQILQRRLEQMKITKEIALGSTTTTTTTNTNNSNCHSIQRINYHDLLRLSDDNDNDYGNDNGNDRIDTTVLLKTLHAIIEQGAVLIQKAPRIFGNENDVGGLLNSTVAKIGRILSTGGQLSHGALYGDIFHVISSSTANNIAYTSVALPPHQDLTYYESKPFLQLLHCVSHTKATYQHGESVLIDAMAAAEEFRLLAPDLFDTLLHCEATFIKQREGADMVGSKPHIQLSPSFKEHGGNVIAVHWSPPFEGGPLLIPPQYMEDYFVAYRAFELMLDNSIPPSSTGHFSSSSSKLSPELEAILRDYAHNYTWEYNLKPGEMLIFNNARMLHGRRAFSIASTTTSDDDNDDDDDDDDDFDGLNHTCSKGRHLVGCYTGAMETLSLYRLLLNDLPDRDHHVVRNAGNGTAGSQ